MQVAHEAEDAADGEAEEHERFLRRVMTQRQLL
jgi:hypothetical protein